MIGTLVMRPLVWALVVGLAAAAPSARADAPDAECPGLQSLERERLSAVWVSPLARAVGNKASLPVVPTAELRAWIDREQPDLARLLQHLGLRRSDRTPKKRWKVTVFEVDAADLCRPVTEGVAVPDLTACSPRQASVGRRATGCGYTTDLADDERGADVFRVSWADAARSGFCVLPAERFLAGG